MLKFSSQQINNTMQSNSPPNETKTRIESIEASDLKISKFTESIDK